MATASAQTGLDDFGDDSFREGLEILVRSLRDEARLNAVGEAFLYPRLVGHLAQRLQIEDWYGRRPEIDDVPIVAPLFGLGLPRTGRWQEVLNTDAESYGGSGVGNLGAVHTEDVHWHGMPASARLRVPPLGALWLRPA